MTATEGNRVFMRGFANEHTFNRTDAQRTSRRRGLLRGSDSYQQDALPIPYGDAVSEDEYLLQNDRGTVAASAANTETTWVTGPSRPMPEDGFSAPTPGLSSEKVSIWLEDGFKVDHDGPKAPFQQGIPIRRAGHMAERLGMITDDDSCYSTAQSGRASSHRERYQYNPHTRQVMPRGISSTGRQVLEEDRLKGLENKLSELTKVMARLVDQKENVSVTSNAGEQTVLIREVRSAIELPVAVERVETQTLNADKPAKDDETTTRSILNRLEGMLQKEREDKDKIFADLSEVKSEMQKLQKSLLDSEKEKQGLLREMNSASTVRQELEREINTYIVQLQSNLKDFKRDLYIARLESEFQQCQRQLMTLTANVDNSATVQEGVTDQPTLPRAERSASGASSGASSGPGTDDLDRTNRKRLDLEILSERPDSMRLDYDLRHDRPDLVRHGRRQHHGTATRAKTLAT